MEQFNKQYEWYYWRLSTNTNEEKKIQKQRRTYQVNMFQKNADNVEYKDKFVIKKNCKHCSRSKKTECLYDYRLQNIIYN